MMATPKEIEAATKVICGQCGCQEVCCIHMIPPPDGNCSCALIALLALEAAERLSRRD